MKLIGYNLVKKQYDKPARLIGGVSKWQVDSEYNPSNYTFDVLIDSYVEKNLQEAGVLELWFEPVFG